MIIRRFTNKVQFTTCFPPFAYQRIRTDAHDLCYSRSSIHRSRYL